ncbi:PepSY-associated TM helix domain-containing protein [Gluconobacter morbifer]|uniref:PepSY-associated TM helix domain-containing protein n=1 Tax=Gluconobacter morbifer G707 TaxID=1088869 RepID=G6XFA1_9PROT|nr:PepSY-associated TM helix domain-containing protein [Gluconobacter morbifer]EHH68859.1 hypothetical protein GMO_01660 [Gluconobacter morbifer G707]
MHETLRTRMGWLHAWIGFAFGLLLVCVFISGTVSVFDTELTRWLQPEAPPEAVSPTADALDRSLPTVHSLMVEGKWPFITFPSPRDPYLRIQHYDGAEFLSVPLDPGTGTPLPVRQTAGGTFFYNLHASLRSGETGMMFVTFSGAALLVMLGSGLIIHLRGLVSDLTLLRPHAQRLRAWLDVHVLSSVPFIPFAIVMAYTGAFIHVRTILPPVSYVTFLRTALTSAPANTAQPPPPVTTKDIPPISGMVTHAEAALGPAGFALFSGDTLLVSRTDASGPELTRDHIDFSLKTGKQTGSAFLTTPIARTQAVLTGLHYGRWAGPSMRWLYFLSGLAGTVMISSGLIFFLMKRRRQSGHLPVFRLAEGLAISVILGFPFAILGVLWANRLIPVGIPDRPIAEVRSFFILWAFSALVGLITSCSGYPLAGWKTLLWGLVLAGTLLTPLDFLTRPGATPFHAPTVFAATDLVALLAALCSFQVARRL